MGSTKMGRARRSDGWSPRRVAAAGSGALLGAVLSVTALSSAAQAAYPGGDGLIALVRGGNIYTVNPAHVAGSLVRLTTDGRASGPRWSPNGKQIAYVDRGNLWVMHADGSHKKRLTVAAPRYTASRPTWSPNGRYLAFVRTERGHPYGYLTRYSFATRTINVFTTTIDGHSRRAAALPAPAAWAWARDPADATHGSYLAYEGAGPLCPHPHEYCLDLLGFPSQSRYSGGFPSAEAAPEKFRLTDPDWYPVDPAFDTDLMTTQEDCPAGHCTPTGLDLTVLAPPKYSGGYEGVYAPAGNGLIAFVRDVHGRPVTYLTNSRARPARLTRGSQPDWQPVVPARPHQLKGGA